MRGTTRIGSLARPLLVTLTWATIGLLLGCPDGDDDDATPGDDDDTTAGDDDDSTPGDDDDDTVVPACEVAGDWTDLLDEPDPQGDAGDYPMDIEAYQVQLQGDQLYLRSSSWTDFDLTDPLLMVDMYLSDGTTHYTLTFDNQIPNPGPLQLWSSSNSWAEPLARPVSMCLSGDGTDAVVMGIDLADLGFEAELALETWTGVDLYEGYLDEAPDGAFEYDIHALIVLEEVPELELASFAVDDAVSGDGDGVIDPGETVDVTLALANTGYTASGAGVTAVLTPSSSATAVAVVTVDTVAFNGGDPIVEGTTASGDATFQVTVDVSAEPGQLLAFDLAVSDDDGNSWSMGFGPFAVGMDELLTDPVDLAASFDPARVYVTVDGSDLLMVVTSHTDHDADQSLYAFLDVDRDGTYDHAVSTVDEDAGAYTGGTYTLVSGSWIQTGGPTEFEYEAGDRHVLFRVPLEELGSMVVAHLYLVCYDASGWYSDQVPDDPEITEDLGLLEMSQAPYMVVLETNLLEQQGNGDEFVDPDERWRLVVELANAGNVDAAAVTAVLSSGVADVVVTQASGDFGAVAVGETALASPPFSVEVDIAAPTNVRYTLDLAVDADAHQRVLTVPLVIGVQAADVAEDAALLPEAITLAGDTALLTDDYQDPAACTGFSASGYDGVYAVELTTGQELQLDLEYDSGPDAVIYVSDDAEYPDDNCLAGADTENYEHEQLDFTAPADGTYYIVVDAFGGGFGPFTLQVTF
jgi:hypothetical protein